nr:SPOR domain-containing protein [Sphingopyxis sp. LK2115]
MRQARLTAKPAHTRRSVGVLGALLLGTVGLPAAQAMQAASPDAATRAAMEKRTAARTLLSSSLARLASNSNDAAALLDAGRASIALEDYRAALGFLLRAEQASPRDGAVKAALGSAMVHSENPTRALDYFGEAQLLGAPERLFLADRGLARDLLGQQDAAQRDYQLALSIAPDAELTRRYALSLGISGDPDRAVQLLTPQLRAQDRGAWRLRAMILAMNGRDKEAGDIVNATMPAPMAANILPYLTQMDRLNPAQKAAAAHFGRFPNGRPAAAQQPVQVAAAPSRPASTPSARRDAPTPAPAVAAPAPKPTPPPAAVPSSRPRVETPAPLPSPPAQPPASAVKAPAGPGFSIADIRPSAPPAAAPAPAPLPAAPSPAASPLASLADIVGSIEIPPEELARPDDAIGADTLARLLEDKRKAEAAEAAKREKDEAAARAKAEADARAKEEAAKKKAHPARIWVQIATGANPKALAFDYNRFAKRNAALFKGKAGAIAEWGQTRRLLVGPFANRKAAQDWLGEYKKAEGDGFLFNSEVGEIVEPLR